MHSLKLDLLNLQRWEILWRFLMLVACIIDTGESKPDGDSNEYPEKRHGCINRRDRCLNRVGRGKSQQVIEYIKLIDNLNFNSLKYIQFLNGTFCT